MAGQEGRRFAGDRQHGAAGTPLTTGDRALLCIDVWEHAYYIDYRNLRPKFVETFLASLANWRFAEQNFAA
jgi:Fe-Mn family superoxide dismutase